MTGFNKEDLQQKLINGNTVYGTCITSNAPRWPKLVAAADLDFVFLDNEHIALDRMELSKMCHIYQAHGLSPIVRILKPDPYRACQAIDDGAIGIVAPYLESIQEIQDLVGATKYRPLKGAKLQEALSLEADLSPDLKEYLWESNKGNLCIANIESMPAVERIDDLLSIEGLDAVFIGPHDLSISMGIPEQYDHPDFIKTVKLIINKARMYTLGVGIHFSLEPERQLYWIKEGANIVIHSSDKALFSQRLQSDMKLLKSKGSGTGKAQGDAPDLTL